MTFTAIACLVGGLLLLIGGGEALMRGAVALARRFGLSDLLIGMTVVAAATSMPELLVTVASGLGGAPDVGVGNVVGSNIANILLILGVGALLCPVRASRGTMLWDSLAMALAMLAFALAAYNGLLSVLEGLLLLAALLAYMVFSYRRALAQHRRPQAAAEVDAADVPEVGAMSLGGALFFVAFGMTALAIGSELLVYGAVEIARDLGVSEALIGITLVAIGTSLPELAATIAAAVRRSGALAVGNVLGSNLFNTALVMPALAFTVGGAPIAETFLRLDLWLMAAIGFLPLPFVWLDLRFGPKFGIFLLLLYGGYLASKVGGELGAVPL